MKKLLLLFFIALNLNTFAQVLLSNNFDTNLGWSVVHTTGTSTNAGWTRVTTGSAPSCFPYAGAGMAKFASYDIAANNVYTMNSPSINFPSASDTYRVRFKMYRDGGYDTDADNVKVYFKNTVAEVGTLLGTVNRSMTLSPVVSTEGWYEYSFNLPANTSGNKYVSFVGTSKYGNNIYIDEILVEKIVNVNVELVNHSISTFILQGNNTIGGNIKNQGFDTITSMDVNWSINGGTTNTYSLSGLSLASGNTLNFSHNIIWNAVPGNYQLSVWVNNINGGTDEYIVDNMINSTVFVGSQAVAKKPFYEEFTSSTCAPCASFNSSVFNSFVDSHENDATILKYQMSWPSPGDPYYTAEGGVRRAYYGVNGVPSLFAGGKNVVTSSAPVESAFTTESNEQAYFVINPTYTVNSNMFSTHIEIMPYLTGQFKVHVAVFENTTTGNVGNNGETSFKHVMMKMLPDANGTTVNFTDGVPYSVDFSNDMSSTFKEEMSDLRAVVFIQYDSQKKVMQSAYATESIASVDENIFDSVFVYPNPSNGLLYFKSDNNIDVKVFDILGKEVLSKTNLINDTVIDLSNFNNGVYFLNINDGKSSGVKKIILNK